MIWTGDKPESKAIEETMTSYFNNLQGFLLVSHGSKVGAGPTLSSSIHESVKQVVDSSFRLMKETVSFYGKLTLSLHLSNPVYSCIVLYKYCQIILLVLKFISF